MCKENILGSYIRIVNVPDYLNGNLRRNWIQKAEKPLQNDEVIANREHVTILGQASVIDAVN